MFNNTGATSSNPVISRLFSGAGNNASNTSPQARALSNASSGASPSANPYPNPVISRLFPSTNSTPAPVTHPAGTTPVTKQTTTDSNGNSTTTHYAPTTPTTTTPTTNGADGTKPITGWTELPNGTLVNQDTGETRVKAGATPTYQGMIGSPANIPQAGSQGTTLQQDQEKAARQNTPGYDEFGNAIPGYVDPNAKPNPYAPTTYTGMIGGLVASAAGNTAIGQKAADLAANYGQQIANVGQQGVMGQAGYRTTGTTPVGEGNSAILGQTIAAQQSALSQGEQAALSGTSQQLSAQAQTASGLLGAAGLTPEALRYGGAAGGTLNPLQNLDSIAQQVISGQLSPSQAEAMGGGISTWSGALNQALIAKDPQYNKGVYEAKFNSTATGAGENITDTQAIQGAQNNIDSITSLIKNGNLNPSSINLANEGIQAIQKNLSNSDYQTLLNSLGVIDAALTKVTGAPVDIATLSSTQGTSLLATINNQVALAKGIAAGKINSGSTTKANNGSVSYTEGQKNSTGDLIYKGGKWIKA